MLQFRFGFYTIKNLGTDIADAIIADRRAHGKFMSITDFLERITHKNLNKKSLEALIKSGAMDAFGERGELLANMETMLEYNKERQNIGSQVSLFGASEMQPYIEGDRPWFSRSRKMASCSK